MEANEVQGFKLGSASLIFKWKAENLDLHRNLVSTTSENKPLLNPPPDSVVIKSDRRERVGDGGPARPPQTLRCYVFAGKHLL